MSSTYVPIPAPPPTDYEIPEDGAWLTALSVNQVFQPIVDAVANTWSELDSRVNAVQKSKIFYSDNTTAPILDLLVPYDDYYQNLGAAIACNAGDTIAISAIFHATAAANTLQATEILCRHIETMTDSQIPGAYVLPYAVNTQRQQIVITGEIDIAVTGTYQLIIHGTWSDVGLLTGPYSVTIRVNS